MTERKNTPVEKVCPYCFNTFTPNPKVGDRQICCGSESCKKKRKQNADKRWRKNNPDYFKNRYSSHLKPWLEKHQGYLKQYRQKKRETADKEPDIQDELTPLENNKLIKTINDIQDKLNDGITRNYLILSKLGDIQDELTRRKHRPYKAFT
jgi:hypothetical protein